MVDEYERISAGLHLLENLPERFDIVLMQSAGGFVEDNQEVVQVAGAKARKAKPLDFAARKRVCRSASGQVADSEFYDCLDTVEQCVENRLLVCVQPAVEQLVQLRFEFGKRGA